MRRSYMTVRELRKLLETAPDDAPVLAPGPDHSYRAVEVHLGTALLEAREQWTEDHGEETTPEAEYGKRIPAVIIT